jgi:ribosomal protein S25
MLVKKQKAQSEKEQQCETIKRMRETEEKAIKNEESLKRYHLLHQHLYLLTLVARRVKKEKEKEKERERKRKKEKGKEEMEKESSLAHPFNESSFTYFNH